MTITVTARDVLWGLTPATLLVLLGGLTGLSAGICYCNDYGWYSYYQPYHGGPFSDPPGYHHHYHGPPSSERFIEEEEEDAGIPQKYHRGSNHHYGGGHQRRSYTGGGGGGPSSKDDAPSPAAQARSALAIDLPDDFDRPDNRFNHLQFTSEARQSDTILLDQPYQRAGFAHGKLSAPPVDFV